MLADGASQDRFDLLEIIPDAWSKLHLHRGHAKSRGWFGARRMLHRGNARVSQSVWQPAWRANPRPDRTLIRVKEENPKCADKISNEVSFFELGNWADGASAGRPACGIARTTSDRRLPRQIRTTK